MKFVETCGGKIINVQAIKSIFISENEDGLLSLIQTRDGYVCDYFKVPDSYEGLDGKQAKVDREVLQEVHRFSIGEICEEGEGLLDYDTLDHNSWARFGMAQEEDKKEKCKTAPPELIDELICSIDKLSVIHELICSIDKLSAKIMKRS